MVWYVGAALDVAASNDVAISDNFMHAKKTLVK